MTFPVGSPGARRPEHLLNRRRSTGGETPRIRPLIRPQTPGRRYRAPRYRPDHGRPNMTEHAACGREYGRRPEASPPSPGYGVETDSRFPRRAPYSPAGLSSAERGVGKESIRPFRSVAEPFD